MTVTGTTTNYDIALNKGDFEITKKPVTITVATATKEYGDFDPSFKASISEYENTDLDDLKNNGLVVTRANTEEAVGGYAGVLVISQTESDLEALYTNYDFTIENGTFDIVENDDPITVTLTGFSVMYDGDKHSATYTVDGPATDKPMTVEVTLANYELTTVGTLTASVTGIIVRDGSGNDVTNYFTNKNTSSTAPIEITRKPVTITVSDVTKVYGDDDPTFEYATISDYIGSDLDRIDLSVARTNDDENVGDYIGVLVINDSENNLEEVYTNYDFTLNAGDFGISNGKYAFCTPVALNFLSSSA